LTRCADAVQSGISHIPSFPNTNLERPHYPTLASILNLHFAEALKSAPERLSGAFYNKLRFFVYDRATGDGVAGAPALQPDLVGLRDSIAVDEGTLKIKRATKLFWSSPEGKVTIDIPVEVKNTWRDLVRQAATYARCLFSASPLRNSALVFGYNHVSQDMRFLLFHRGGLTSSTALNLLSAEGQRGILRIFLALLTCRNYRDLGFPEWCNEREVRLPINDPRFGAPEFVNLRVDSILHSYLCCRGRATRVYRLSFDHAARRAALKPTTVVGRRSPVSEKAKTETRRKAQTDARPKPSRLRPSHEKKAKSLPNEADGGSNDDMEIQETGTPPEFQPLLSG
jgi:hypothetical protein